MQGDPIKGRPKFDGECKGCMKCLAICPGLAITLVDFRKDKALPTVFLPYEIYNYPVEKGDLIDCVDVDGVYLGRFEALGAKATKDSNRTQIVRIKAHGGIARKIAGFTVQKKEITMPVTEKIPLDQIRDDEIICLCEMVTAGQIRDLVKKGVTDMNQIKALTRAGMGPCGYKTCENLMKQIFRAEKVDMEDMVLNTRRPLFVEVPLGKFANGGQK
jgi:bacterioferritin-associated ferredoxin